MISQKLIESWLSDESVRYEPLEAQGDAQWQLLVGYPQVDSNLNVIAVKPDQSALVIRRDITVSPEHRSMLKGLSGNDFQEYKYQLVRDLLCSRVQYRLEFDDESEGESTEGNVPQDLKQVILQEVLLEEGVTKSSFFNSMLEVFDAGILVVVHTRKAIGAGI